MDTITTLVDLRKAFKALGITGKDYTRAKHKLFRTNIPVHQVMLTGHNYFTHMIPASYVDELRTVN